MKTISNDQMRILGARYRAEAENDLNEALLLDVDPGNEYRRLVGAFSELSDQVKDCGITDNLRCGHTSTQSALPLITCHA